MFFNPVFLWALLGLILIGSEFVLPGFVIFFFGTGAILTSLLSALIPGLGSSWMLQALIWIASSGFSLIFLRKKFAKIFRGKLITGKDESELHAGKKAEVVEDITPDNPGRIKFQGTTWKAISYTESFKPGESVEILKEESLTFVVTKSIIGNSLDIHEDNPE